MPSNTAWMYRFIGFVLLLVGAFQLYGITTRNAADPNTVDTTRVADNRSIIAKCHDPKLCVGGFVKWNSTIYIISSGYPGRGFVPLEGLVEMGNDDKKLNQIEFIRIPSDSSWNITAGAYARQFVIQK